MFRRLLIANRGEIARRIIRTARRLGLSPIAVYSEADRAALHVREADHAVLIGPAPARESYLNIPALIEAARRSGAEAVHPGYGFLSENAEFAEACEQAGLIFIGPPPAAIRAMGSKAAAKALMEEAGVPVVPGYHGDQQDEAHLAAIASRLGFPLLIKAAAGGGGKGMRIVRDAAAFAEALAGARREAEAAFGDGRVLLERYLERPRHIEIQVFADRAGNTFHLFERDCSIQRRYQKIIEEAPAFGLDAALRAEMGAAAVRAARAVGYVGAGTVEFIYQDGAFYFMEMNTRLQVEHPVTEMITGFDLVEWQIRVAAGEPLPWRQEALAPRGHAIEARIYAEDPERGFLPASGVLRHLREPPLTEGIRLDSGVAEGDRISIHYDPMIAKLIAWGENREQARERLLSALGAFEIGGLKTNLRLLEAILAHPDFAASPPDTSFIARHPELLAPPPAALPRPLWAAAALALLERSAARARDVARRRGDPFSPWAENDGFRIGGREGAHLMLSSGAERRAVTLFPEEKGRWRFADEAGESRLVLLACEGEDWRVELDGETAHFRIAPEGEGIAVFGRSVEAVITEEGAGGGKAGGGGGDGRLMAPIPGQVRRVLVEPGARVTAGQTLIVLEAMKMEITLSAPFDGEVESLAAEEGAQVGEGSLLATLRPG
jgi:3-methylcrotonyl-CoA carboxylase alpha subunit